MIKSIKASKLVVIALTITAIVLTSTTVAVLTVNQNVSSSGTVSTSPNIGVYSDSGCTQSLTTINWGTVDPGASETQTIYVKNTGTASMTLAMSVTNWNPAGASTYMALTWNRQDTELSPGQSTAATLTLTVNSGITGITNFSNSITISGTG
ncbi:MAG: hypothetical protein ACQCN6_00575 [Candidatus Bathyarchaeia archaeon]|jgi:hypothetical protein